MIRRLICFAVLALCSAATLESVAQTKEDATKWAERHRNYTDPKISESESGLRITVNAPRPLYQVLLALGARYDWRINYEDPRYGGTDVLDDTAPSWLLQHPKGPYAYGVAGGAFTADISLPGSSPYQLADPVQVLPLVVKAYNESGNPGRFELRKAADGAFALVGIAADGGPQSPVLDTLMNFDTSRFDSVDDSLAAFCGVLSWRAGALVEYIGFSWFTTGSGAPSQGMIELHARKKSAREILRQMLVQIDATLVWRLLYDPDDNVYRLLVRHPDQMD
jgi:hypothetical protein